ncbi:MAG: ABC transporter permease [Bacteroidetes bacterium]|nr:MAG: ABC transporter permease [Bacteroidota bacterium]
MSAVTNHYSQPKAMLAITKASLRSILRSPSAIVFSIGFPLIFILVFGFLGGGKGGVNLTVGIKPGSDTVNPAYQMVRAIPGIKVITEWNQKAAEDLSKGRITALLAFSKSDQGVPYRINLTTSEAVKPQDVMVLQSLLNSVNTPNVVAIDKNVEKVPGRIYRTIDFILPGQLGFSLLSAGIFGVAFLFFNLRQQLVLKRFFATPINRFYIVMGEGIARMIFQLMTAVIIVGLGHYVFHFTLVNGWVTFLQILLLSAIALVVFMGFGFIVSGVAKNESTIPPFANLVTMPQFLLSGTFFPIENFPKWLQPICKILPLTHYNNAMRAISFEGASFASVADEVGVLLIWGVAVYAAAVKFFKWE